MKETRIVKRLLSFGIKRKFIQAHLKSYRRLIDYRVFDIEESSPEHYLDAIMLLSGSNEVDIKSTAFSSLSNLSEISSVYPPVMAQVKRDIESEDDYFKFITQRIDQLNKRFYSKFSDKSMERQCSGFSCLLSLAHDSNENEVQLAMSKLNYFMA